MVMGRRALIFLALLLVSTYADPSTNSVDTLVKRLQTQLPSMGNAPAHIPMDLEAQTEPITLTRDLEEDEEDVAVVHNTGIQDPNRVVGADWIDSSLEPNPALDSGPTEVSYYSRLFSSGASSGEAVSTGVSAGAGLFDANPPQTDSTTASSNAVGSNVDASQAAMGASLLGALGGGIGGLILGRDRWSTYVTPEDRVRHITVQALKANDPNGDRRDIVISMDFTFDKNAPSYQLFVRDIQWNLNKQLRDFPSMDGMLVQGDFLYHTIMDTQGRVHMDKIPIYRMSQLVDGGVYVLGDFQSVNKICVYAGTLSERGCRNYMGGDTPCVHPGATVDYSVPPPRNLCGSELSVPKPYISLPMPDKNSEHFLIEAAVDAVRGSRDCVKVIQITQPDRDIDCLLTVPIPASESGQEEKVSYVVQFFPYLLSDDAAKHLGVYVPPVGDCEDPYEPVEKQPRTRTDAHAALRANRNANAS